MSSPRSTAPRSQTSRGDSLAPAFAALDLGTNNCRMLVAAPSGDGFRVLDSFSRIVRLGEGLHRTGRAQSRGDGAGDRRAERLRRPAGAAAGAQAARNRHRGVPACGEWRGVPARVKHETGLDIGVISSREEARAGARKLCALLGGWGRRALLFDIGGGSTELAWVRPEPTGGPS